MRTLIKIVLVFCILFAPFILIANAQESNSDVNIQNIPAPEAKEWFGKTIISPGPENQWEIRNYNNLFEQPEVNRVTINIPLSCNPIPNIQKNPGQNSNLGPNDTPVIILGSYCSTNSTLSIKLAATHNSFPVSSDTIHLFGYVSVVEKSTGNLVGTKSFDTQYNPSSVQLPPQVNLSFVIPFDGNEYQMQAVLATKQSPCNNGGTLNATGDFSSGTGSLRVTTYLGCTKCGELIIKFQDKTGWVEIFRKQYPSGTDVNEHLPLLKEGVYQVIFNFCDGSVFDSGQVNISSSNPNLVFSIPGQYGNCLPLVINQPAPPLGCPTDHWAKIKTSKPQEFWPNFSRNEVVGSRTNPILVGGCSEKVTITFRKGAQFTATQLESMPNGKSTLTNLSTNIVEYSYGSSVDTFEFWGCTHLVGLTVYKFNAKYLAPDGSTCSITAYLKDPPQVELLAFYYMSSGMTSDDAYNNARNEIWDKIGPVDDSTPYEDLMPLLEKALNEVCAEKGLTVQQLKQGLTLFQER